MLPYRTDAPVYYYPYATIGLIGINTLFWIACWKADPLKIANYILVYGDGLHPLQWLTSNFIHIRFGHLFGNMVFLWVFGLVVEGKLGPLRFLAIYLGIGFVQCGIEQAMMLGTRGASYGNSSILFALAAMTLIWAPKNEIDIVFFVWYYPFFFSLVLFLFVPLLLVKEFFFLSITGYQVSSAFLHLMGAAIGFPLAIFMLKAQWVDCEGWDLFSVLKGKPTRRKERLYSIKELKSKKLPKGMNLPKDAPPTI